LPFEEPRGELPEERLLLPEERVTLGRGALVGALYESLDPLDLLDLLDPLDRLLEFQSEVPPLESVSLEGDACIQRFRRLSRSGVTTVG
jgi:hypothetical protein